MISKTPTVVDIIGKGEVLGEGISDSEYYGFRP